MTFIYFMSLVFWIIILNTNWRHSYNSTLYSIQRMQNDPKIRNDKLDTKRWGPLLGFCYRGFLPLCISTQLNYGWPLLTTSGEMIAYAWSLFLSVVIYIWFPLTMIYVISVPKERLLEPRFKTKYGFLFNGIRTDTVGQRCYFLVFILRRYTLIMMAMHMMEFPAIQVILLLLTNTFIMIFSTMTQPFKTKEDLNNDMLSEWCVMCLSYHLLLFTSDGPDVDIQYYLGWSYVLFIAAMLSNNFWKIGKTLVHDLWIKAKKYWGLLKLKCKSLHARWKKSRVPVAVEVENDDHQGLDDEEITLSDATEATSAPAAENVLLLGSKLKPVTPRNNRKVKNF